MQYARGFARVWTVCFLIVLVMVPSGIAAVYSGHWAMAVCMFGIGCFGIVGFYKGAEDIWLEFDKIQGATK